MRDTPATMLDSLYSWLQRDFPPAEVKSRAQFDRLVTSGRYTVYLADHSIRGIVGYAVIYRAPSPPIAWLDYLAIIPEHRGSGLGAALMDALRDQLRPHTLGLMMEVDPPTSADPRVRRDQQRRIAFYRRVGAQQLAVDYRFPTVSGSVPMLLFYRPIAALDILSKAQLQELIRAVYASIHDDIEGRDALLATFIDTIGDVSLR